MEEWLRELDREMHACFLRSETRLATLVAADCSRIYFATAILEYCAK